MTDAGRMTNRELSAAWFKSLEDMETLSRQMLPMESTGDVNKFYNHPLHKRHQELSREFERRSHRFFRGAKPGFVGTHPEDPKRLRFWDQIKTQHSLDHYSSRAEPRVWVAPTDEMAQEVAEEFDLEGFPYKLEGKTFIVDPTKKPRQGWIDPFYLGERHEMIRIGRGGRPETYIALGEAGAEVLRKFSREDRGGRRRDVRVRPYRRKR